MDNGYRAPFRVVLHFRLLLLPSWTGPSSRSARFGSVPRRKLPSSTPCRSDSATKIDLKIQQNLSTTFTNVFPFDPNPGALSAPASATPRIRDLSLARLAIQYSDLHSDPFK